MLVWAFPTTFLTDDFLFHQTGLLNNFPSEMQRNPIMPWGP